MTGEETGLEARRGLHGTAPRAVRLDDDKTRTGSHRDTKYRAPWRAARCESASRGSNVIHEYSATRSNAGRDGAEVSSGHSRRPGAGVPKGQTMRHKEQT